MIKHDFLPDPLILIDFRMEMGPTTFQIDRSCECNHFGLCTFWEKKQIIRPNTRRNVDLLIFGIFQFWVLAAGSKLTTDIA